MHRSGPPFCSHSLDTAGDHRDACAKGHVAPHQHKRLALFGVPLSEPGRQQGHRDRDDGRTDQYAAQAEANPRLQRRRFLNRIGLHQSIAPCRPLSFV